VAIDYDRARAQHERYCQTLKDLGCTLVEIPADPAFPDSVFVEDTVVVLDDLAVLTRPGAESRRGEVEAMAEVLAPLRRLLRIEAPATIDGGDVLVLDGTICVGLSSRTNAEAVEQLRRLTGRTVVAVTVNGALHLKTAVTRVAADTLLLNPRWIDAGVFAGWRTIEIDPEEPFSANALWLPHNGAVVYPSAFGRTAARLAAAGISVHSVDADELAKAEGGVTCSAVLVGSGQQ
jgi:dimethylargininase